MRRLAFTEADEVFEASREAARVIAEGGVLLLPTESY